MSQLSSIDVVGPTRMGHFIVFGVVRQFPRLRLKFKIMFEERANKWHHTSFDEAQEGLCYERLYAPTKDCACIRECKERLKNG